VATREEVEAFLAEADLSRSYQCIALGHGLHTPGTDRGKSFRQAVGAIASLEGKTYLDIGCMWGAMVFMAKEAGAKYACGWDKRGEFVSVARRIAELKDADVKFWQRDILTHEAPGAFDVVTMFNVLHHLRYPFLALHNALKSTKEWFIIEFPTLKGRWEKLRRNGSRETDVKAMGGPYLGIIHQETGLYFTRWSMETAVNWFGEWDTVFCEWSPHRHDRLLMTFRRIK
jgi:SAM-dependent methyltransferase